MDHAASAEARPGKLPSGLLTFPGISSFAYEHPSAKTALIALQKIKGFDLLLRKMHAAIGEPRIRMEHLSSAVRITPRQFGRLHRIKAEAVEILDLADEPELYVRSMGVANAMTVGMDRPFVVVSSELVSVMNEAELRFVIGHELGHALSGHALYQTMARVLATVGFSSFPVAGLAVEAVEQALLDWGRKSELSSDRAGLLTVQDLDTALRALLKLAAGPHVDEMDTTEFLAQSAEYELDGGLKQKLIKFLLPSGTHPILVKRAAELDRWVRREGSYADILRGAYPLRADDRQQTVRDAMRDSRQERAEVKEVKRLDRLSRLPGQLGPFGRGKGE
ncbi:M48 family metallopeptidase [Kitasatospora sp. NPDC058965]|uniref:M48 family metallopeptidase n=1 Tax=Kitasatospora sp. NPDC058965 TaxID=3346682 RepID=UPI003690B510